MDLATLTATLVMGSYAFTAGLWRWIVGRFDRIEGHIIEIRKNDLIHLEARIEVLESKVDRVVKTIIP